MVAGLNLKIRIWRNAFPSDDTIGGAMVSGTVAYNSVDARILAVEPDQMFLQQGLETLHTFRCTCRPASLVVYERDEVEIIWPLHHKLYGKRFRVDGVTEENFHPSDYRGYLLLNLSRSDRSHGNQ